MKYRYFFFIIFIVVGCRSSNIVAPDKSNPPEYSIVYVIHGDANYLYHNEEGEALQADEQVLEEAKSVGQSAKNGEVFIFHQKAERQILWLFPKKDRQFLYYRNGSLVGKKNYSPASQSTSFTREAALYYKYSPDIPWRAKIFLYFGHEIPVRAHSGYHTSRPDVPFNTEIFAAGLGTFRQAGKSPFDLVVLSTCNNGTPSMIHTLTPHSRYILASPQNLHLSHIDTGALATLLEQPENNILQTAEELAQNTYQRLTSFLQTTITLSVYDTRQTETYLPALAGQYKNHLEQISSSELLSDNGDCSLLSFFNTPKNSGVQTWYNPPQFGEKKKNNGDYSGWGCKK